MDVLPLRVVASDTQFLFRAAIPGFDVGIAEGPVNSNTIPSAHPKIVRQQPRRMPQPVPRRPAHPTFIRAEIFLLGLWIDLLIVIDIAGNLAVCFSDRLLGTWNFVGLARVVRS